MKKILKTLRKHWTRVWLITVLLLSGGIYVTHAAYTEVSSVKRVVSTQASPGDMFSSNCMRADVSSRRLTSPEYSVTVCNFDQDKPTTYNPSTIKYVLHAELLIKQGDSYLDLSEYLKTLDQNKDDEKAIYDKYMEKAAKYFIYKTEDDVDETVTTSNKGFVKAETDENGDVTKSIVSVDFDTDTLAPQVSSVDKYKVEIDSEAIDDLNTDIFVYVWAKPTEPSDLSTIYTRLYGAKVSADTATWNGTFIETDCDTVDYDFYNYVITGSGSGTVDILWNEEKFEINPFFFDTTLSGNTFVGGNTPETIESNDEKYGSDKYEDEYVGWKKITIKVGSVSSGDFVSKNRYELQLYKTLSDSSYTGDNAATKYITCFFNKSS